MAVGVLQEFEFVVPVLLVFHLVVAALLAVCQVVVVVVVDLQYVEGLSVEVLLFAGELLLVLEVLLFFVEL